MQAKGKYDQPILLKNCSFEFSLKAFVFVGTLTDPIQIQVGSGIMNWIMVVELYKKKKVGVVHIPLFTFYTLLSIFGRQIEYVEEDQMIEINREGVRNKKGYVDNTIQKFFG